MNNARITTGGPTIAHAQVSPSPFVVGLMYFGITGYGFWLIIWLWKYLCGYPTTGVSGHVLVYRTSIVVAVFYLYFLWRIVRFGSFKMLAGLSWGMIVFWSIASIRLCHDAFYFSPYPYLAPFFAIFIPVLIVAFSIPVNKKSIRVAFWWVYVPLFLLCLVILCQWYDTLIDGYSFRDEHWVKEKFQIIVSLFTIRNRGILSMREFGAILGLLSFWAWTTRKLRPEIAMIGYAIGTILCFAMAAKAVVLSWIVVHFFLFIFTKCWKDKRSLIIIPIMLACNLFCLYYVGKNDHMGITERVIHFQNELAKSETSSACINDNNILHNLPNGALVLDWTNCPTRPISPRGKEQGNIFNFYPNTEARMLLYTTILDAVKKYPLTGYGTRLVFKLDQEQYRTISPHSNVLGIFLATGLIGGFLFLGLIGIGLRDSIVILWRHHDFGWLTVFFLFIFVNNLTSSTVFSPILFISLVALHACIKTKGG